jgi:gliding motility-associated-like protein
MNFNQLGAATTEGVWAGDPIDGWFGFNGCIDEFIIVDKSLTASQIQQVTALPQPTITSFAPTTAKSGETVTITGTNLSGTSAVKLGGVAARSFTIVSATEVRAIVGKDASLTTDVEVTTAAGAVNAPNFAFDCTNNALDFDGINDHVIIGDQIESFGALTQEAWVYWKGSSAIYTEIFTKDLVSAFTITSGNRLHANFGNGSNWGAGVNSTTLIPLNTWTHVAVTRSAAGVVKMYINGVLDVSTAILNLSGGNAAIRAIGAKPVGATNYGSFNGAIDELKVWNTERTAAQIQGGMNSELVGDGAGLVAYYNFNQGTAGGTNTGITTLNNLTPAVNLSGTLTNLAGSGPTSNFVRGVWPVIITQPVSSSSVCAGSGSLTVSAVGSQLTYQWYSNASASNSGGAAISGATAATLTIPSTATGTNYYYVVVSGACSQSVTSTVSTVTVTPAPVAPVADAAQLFCGSAPTLYKFARIVFSDVKSFGSANSIQVAEWRWLTGNTVISQSGTTVTNPGGSNPSGEGPQNIYDGNTSSKWLDFNIKLGNNTSTLQFAFPGQGFEITGYSWTTANDSEERDPRSWKVFMSVDGTNWTEVDSRTGIAAPSGRFTSAGSWSYATPVGGSNAGGLTATALAGHTLKWYTVATGGIGTSTAPSVDASNPGVFTYYVSQVNAGGCESTRTAITATVAPLPVMTYAPTIRLERSLAISSITPTTTGAAIVLYGVSPALPQGLSIDSTTGVISGTPTTTSAATTYTVSGTTAAGCVGTATFSLEVFLPLAPSALSYSPATQTVRQGTAITAMTPTISGGAPTYTISPSLPAGLSINATTGVISGTLTAAQTGTVTYTITATNSGGSTTATVSLVFNTAPTAIALAPATVAENAASGTTVGTLSATDADTGDTFTFALVSGTSDTDNASFTVDGTSLKTAAVFDFETKNGYSVRVRVTDAGGLTFERQLIISVTDENEDRDGDGVKDNEEAADGTDPLDACSFKIASQNATPSDAWKAADCDNDGLTNQQEKDLGTDPLKADTDGDGVPDGVEVTDGTDPLDASKYKDTDGDLVPNFVETAEGTATGDALKYKDSDKDGVPDYIELRDGTNPNSASSFKDTDGGGVPDYVEVTLFPNLGLAATNATQRGDDEQDTDGDGVPDYQEVLAGDSPTDASDFLDTDGDGVPDFVERKQGTDPNNSKDAKDSDGDGVPDHVQVRSIQLSVLKQLNLAWGTKNHLAQLPTTVEVGIYSGEKTNFEVVWNKTETVNILKRGTYELKGTIVLPKGYYNPYLVNGVIRVTVLPKPAPRDLTITKDTFVGSTTQFFISVGDFVVNDPVDNIHVVSLLGDGYDNKYFEIKSNILFWSSADRAPGKTTFSIVVRVTDRDGNTLDKFFTINRTRPAFDSLTIYNTFTPNADRFNDTWGVPEVRFYEGARISVYERGGARVFYTENPDVRWDGTYEGKEMPVGSYYWVIQIDETGATRRGIVNLLRK